MTSAAKVAGISRQQAYVHKSEDEDFAKAWQEAENVGVDLIYQILHRRATRGQTARSTVTTDYIRNKDGQVERKITTTETDLGPDTVSLFRLLAAHRPEQFGPLVAQTLHRHVGADGGTIKHEVYRQLTPERALELITLAAEKKQLEAAEAEDAEFEEIPDDEGLNGTGH